MDAHTQWAVTQLRKSLHQGNAAAVVELGEHLVAHGDDDLEVFMLASFCLALAHEELGNWDRSLAWFDDCLKIDPRDPILLAGRGRILMKMGREKSAADIFHRLVEQYPDRADYHQGAGMACIRMGEIERAMGYLSAAHKLDPENPYILNELGTAHILMGDMESAMTAFVFAIERMETEDQSLARNIRDNLEEVRAALALEARASGPLGVADIVDLYETDPPGEKETTVAERAAAGPPSPDKPDPVSDAVRERLLEVMRDQTCRSRQVLAAIHLWEDFLESVPRRMHARIAQSPESWAAAVLYAVGRLDGEPWGRQRVIAQWCQVPESAISRRFGRLCRTLSIEVGDPRYCTVANRQRDQLLEEIHSRRRRPESLALAGERRTE